MDARGVPVNGERQNNDVILETTSDIDLREVNGRNGGMKNIRTAEIPMAFLAILSITCVLSTASFALVFRDTMLVPKTCEVVSTKETITTGDPIIKYIAADGAEVDSSWWNPDWKQTLSQARGSRVRFAKWDGNSAINKWVDEWLIPQLQSHHQITLERIGKGAGPKVAEIKDQMDKGEPGTADLLWVNGVNFYNLKSRGHLYGPWVHQVPNSQNFNLADPNIAFDHGVANENYEMPYNLAQCTFFYDVASWPHVAPPPSTVPELLQFIKDNPGKVGYSAPPEFLGSAFVKHIFNYFVPYDKMIGPDKMTVYAEESPKVWAALNEIEPFLWRDSTGNPYPEQHGTITDAFSAGELLIEIAYDPAAAATKIKAGTWPDTIRPFLLNEGTVSNVNFVAIPKNAPNIPGAMVVANFIASQEAMFTRAQPERWGALQAFDPTAEPMLHWDSAFDYINSHYAMPSVEELGAKRVPEMPAEIVANMENDWKTFVGNAF
jgi:putative spermidine/putrescine transport system substrate-binding protein